MSFDLQITSVNSRIFERIVFIHKFLHPIWISVLPSRLTVVVDRFYVECHGFISFYVKRLGPLSVDIYHTGSGCSRQNPNYEKITSVKILFSKEMPPDPNLFPAGMHWTLLWLFDLVFWRSRPQAVPRSGRTPESNSNSSSIGRSYLQVHGQGNLAN